MLDLQVTCRYCNVTGEIQVTIQTARHFCHYSYFLKVTFLQFLLTQLMLFTSWISEGAEKQIVIYFLIYLMQKASYGKYMRKTLDLPRQDRYDVFPLNLSNADGLDIFHVIIAYVYYIQLLYILYIIVLILVIAFFYIFDQRGNVVCFNIFLHFCLYLVMTMNIFLCDIKILYLNFYLCMSILI